MKTTERIETIKRFTSEVDPKYTTEDPQYAKLIEWADNFPVVYKICGEHSRSKAFGMNSSVWMGCQRGPGISSALSRLQSYKQRLEDGGIFGWSAQFTLEHYADKGFTGGFFQENDGKYDRGCMTLDYTPKTRDEVIAAFIAWCKSGYDFGCKIVMIDKKIVRTLKKDVDKAG